MESRDRSPVSQYLERIWGELEKGLEEGVRRALVRVKVPRREDVAELTQRLDAAERRLSALLKR